MVILTLRDKVFEVKAGMCLQHALQKIGVDEQAVLAVRNGEIITDEEILRDGDEIKLVAVISGGQA